MVTIRVRGDCDVTGACVLVSLEQRIAIYREVLLEWGEAEKVAAAVWDIGPRESTKKSYESWGEGFLGNSVRWFHLGRTTILYNGIVEF